MGKYQLPNKKKKKTKKYPKKPQQCYKIPFMSLNCICHSFLVVPRHLKSCCRGDQNQMLLIDNFTTAISKIIALSKINNYHTLASYDIFLGPGCCLFTQHTTLRLACCASNGSSLPSKNHHLSQHSEFLLNHWSYSAITSKKLKHCHWTIFLYVFLKFLKASDLTDATKITAKQPALALELFLFLYTYNSRQVLRICIHLPQILK